MRFYGTQSLLHGFNKSSDFSLQVISQFNPDFSINMLYEFLKTPHWSTWRALGSNTRCWRSYLWQESVCWGVDALDQWEYRKIKCRPSQRWHAHCFFDLIGQIKPGSRGPTLSNKEDRLYTFTAQLQEGSQWHSEAERKKSSWDTTEEYLPEFDPAALNTVTLCLSGNAHHFLEITLRLFFHKITNWPVE